MHTLLSLHAGGGQMRDFLFRKVIFGLKGKEILKKLVCLLSAALLSECSFLIFTRLYHSCAPYYDVFYLVGFCNLGTIFL